MTSATVATGKTVDEALAELNRLGLGEFEALFRECTARKESSLVGTYRAHFIGPAWLRWSAPLGLPLVGLKNWCGKRLDGEGSAVNRVERNGTVSTAVPMQAAMRKSWIDGRDTYTLTYSSTYPWPLRHLRDELREWAPGYLLGMTWADLPLMRKVALPFLLVRENS